MIGRDRVKPLRIPELLLEVNNQSLLGEGATHTTRHLRSRPVFTNLSFMKNPIREAKGLRDSLCYVSHH